MNLDDYNREVLSKLAARFAANAAYKQITRENALADMLWMGYTPPTRWQKFAEKMKAMGLELPTKSDISKTIKRAAGRLR